MRKNLFLLGILVVVVGLVFVSKARKQKKEEAEKQQVFHFAEDDVVGLHFVYDGNDIQLNKTNDVWMITFPEFSYADQSEAQANVKNFLTANYLSIVSKSTNNLSKWGLDHSSNHYSFFIKDRKGKVVTHRIREGAKVAVPQAHYALVDDRNEVYSLDYWVIESLKKSLPELRNKEFCLLEPEEITVLSYRKVADDIKTSTPIAFVKNGFLWELQHNGHNYATNETDIKKIEDVIQTFGFLKADRVYFESDEIKRRTTNQVFVVDFKGIHVVKKQSSRSGDVLTNKANENFITLSYVFNIFLYGDEYFIQVENKKALYLVEKNFKTVFEDDHQKYLKTN